MNQPASAYFMEERHEPAESHTLSVLVQNEPGLLARVTGLFSGRGYNIESLTVSETENQKHVSRITIVTTGTPMVIEQIKHQLDRMVPVYRVVGMTLTGRSIERELAMLKLRGTGAHRAEALRLAEACRARATHAPPGSAAVDSCGNGVLACEAALMGAEVDAIDISPAMLALAEIQARDRKVRIRTQSAGLLSFAYQPNSYDLVVSEFALHHLPDFWKAVALARIFCALKPGSSFYLRDIVFVS